MGQTPHSLCYSYLFILPQQRPCAPSTAISQPSVLPSSHSSTQLQSDPPPQLPLLKTRPHSPARVACRYDLYGSNSDPASVPCDSPFRCYFLAVGADRYRETITPTLHPQDDAPTYPLDAANFVDDANWDYIRRIIAGNHDCLLHLAKLYSEEKGAANRTELLKTAEGMMTTTAAATTVFKELYDTIRNEAPQCTVHATNLLGPVFDSTRAGFHHTFKDPRHMGPAQVEALYETQRSSYLMETSAAGLIECAKSGKRLSQCEIGAPIAVERFCMVEFKMQEERAAKESAEASGSENKGDL